MANNNNDKEFRVVENELKKIELELVEKYPQHFSTRDVINSFMGAFILAITFVFKGNFLHISFALPWTNVTAVIVLNILLLMFETYFIGYKRVTDKKRRKLPQFMAKRVVTFYGISIIVSSLLVLLFNIEYFANSIEEVQKLIFVMALPASMGAAIGDLVKKYY